MKSQTTRGRSMKSATSRFVVFALALVLAVGAGAAAIGEARGTTREHFPWPFESVNRKVELAGGEFYTLAGIVVIGASVNDPMKEQAYFEVDLSMHPWLASKK